MSTYKQFSDKKIAVLGLGVEGTAITAFLIKHGATVTVCDAKEEKELDQGLVQGVKKLGGTLQLGRSYLQNLSSFDTLVRSPGIKRSQPEIIAAEKNGVEITSQTQLFFDLCPSPIIGVTGTKGKGTTSSLIFHMLQKAGKDVHLGGNIGLPPITFLDRLTPKSIVVLELSSFQLQDLTKSPHIAVMLMITSEHLDYHADINEYIQAKRNILRFQTSDDYAVLNRDYLATNESDIHTDGNVLFISREREVDEGCFVRDEGVWIRTGGREQKIINTKDIKLPGKHNWENVCAAVMAATLAGVEKYDIALVLTSFSGLEHRLELVGVVRGVKYYDDSFSTTPETAIAAIAAFTAPEILILGGSSKSSDFKTLGEVIGSVTNIKAIIGIGEEWEHIKTYIQNPTSQFLLIEGADSMEKIVQAAAKIATEGDVVLLSPACASFDMFKNYKDRGEQFKQAVLNLS
jgi:UDP-N-acetylmuramoylalanine--D-glutamate ligase